MGQTDRVIRNEVAAELSRRELLQRGGALGAAAAVISALPLIERLGLPEQAAAADPLSDATLQAFFDTIIPGRKVDVTDLGNSVHPLAIAGVDPEPGAVEADALLLAHHPKIGFDALAPTFLAELEARSLPRGGDFLNLDYERRQAVCVEGLAYSNSTRVLWEAAAAVPFTAFTAAATQINATIRTASGYQVLGHPGTAPHGYKRFSFRKRLARGRTKKGYLP
ncbi:MAG: DUF5987 family protein [Actinomycetota bacterium]